MYINHNNNTSSKSNNQNKFFFINNPKERLKISEDILFIILVTIFWKFQCFLRRNDLL